MHRIPTPLSMLSNSLGEPLLEDEKELPADTRVAAYRGFAFNDSVAAREHYERTETAAVDERVATYTDKVAKLQDRLTAVCNLRDNTREKNAVAKLVAAAEECLRNARGGYSIIKDTLDLTLPVEEQTNPMYVITTHTRNPNTTIAIIAAPSTVDSWRTLHLMTDKGVQLRVVDLLTCNYMATRDWIERFTYTNPVEPSVLTHWASYKATLTGMAMVVGEHRRVFNSPDGLTLNTWKGYTCEPEVWGRESGTLPCVEVALWLHLWYTRICSCNLKLFVRCINWLANMFQLDRPRATFALIVTSKTQGTGKDSAFKVASDVLGDHSRSDPSIHRTIVADSNAALTRIRFMLISENRGKGNKAVDASMMDTFFTLITESRATVRSLYKDAWVAYITTQFAICSNDPDGGVQAKNFTGMQHQRRMQYTEVKDVELPPAYGRLLQDPLSTNFHKQVLHFLQTLRITDPLDNAWPVEQTRHVNRAKVLETHPILDHLVAIANMPEADMLQSELGAATRLKSIHDHKNAKIVAVNAASALPAAPVAEPESLADKIAAAVHNGWYSMKSGTLNSRCSQLVSPGPAARQPGNMGFTSHITAWRHHLAAAVNKWQDYGFHPDGHQQLQDVLQQSTTVAVVPTTQAGWRAFISAGWDLDFDELVETLGDGLPPTDCRVLTNLTEDHYDQLDGMRGIDNIYHDVCSAVAWVELNRVNGTGIFSSRFDFKNENARALLPFSSFADSVECERFAPNAQQPRRSPAPARFGSGLNVASGSGVRNAEGYGTGAVAAAAAAAAAAADDSDEEAEPVRLQARRNHQFVDVEAEDDDADGEAEDDDADGEEEEEEEEEDSEEEWAPSPQASPPGLSMYQMHLDGLLDAQIEDLQTFAVRYRLEYLLQHGREVLFKCGPLICKAKEDYDFTGADLAFAVWSRGCDGTAVNRDSMITATAADVVMRARNPGQLFDLMQVNDMFDLSVPVRRCKLIAEDIFRFVSLVQEDKVSAWDNIEYFTCEHGSPAFTALARVALQLDQERAERRQKELQETKARADSVAQQRTIDELFVRLPPTPVASPTRAASAAEPPRYRRSRALILSSDEDDDDAPALKRSSPAKEPPTASERRLASAICAPTRVSRVVAPPVAPPAAADSSDDDDDMVILDLAEISDDE